MMIAAGLGRGRVKVTTRAVLGAGSWELGTRPRPQVPGVETPICRQTQKLTTRCQSWTMYGTVRDVCVARAVYPLQTVPNILHTSMVDNGARCSPD